jgi:hypothetical protein
MLPIVVLVRKIEEGLQGFDRSAALRYRQRQHTRGSTEPHWRASEHSPAVGTNRNGAPMLIGKIKIEPAGMLGDAGIDRALGTIKLRAGFEQIER